MRFLPTRLSGTVGDTISTRSLAARTRSTQVSEPCGPPARAEPGAPAPTRFASEPPRPPAAAPRAPKCALMRVPASLPGDLRAAPSSQPRHRDASPTLLTFPPALR